MNKTIDELAKGHPAAEAELEQLRNRVGQLQDQVSGGGRVVNSDKMREAIKGWLDANVHDGEDRSGASDVAYFTPDELQELVEECLEAVAVQRPVAEVIPNTVGVEMAWIDPRNKPPVGAKLYTLAQQPESDPRDGCELECGAYGTYCRCKDRAAYERQAQQPESEPVPFEVGGHYRTQVGKWVKFVKVHNQGTRHETMADENGVHRYTNRPGDMGRVTGTAHDYSDWRNTPPTYASPQPSAQIPNEQGKNRYGLDMSYFRNLINRELNRPLTDFRPDEFARVCARMAATADREVLQESEFGRKQPSPQVPEGLLEACREVQEFDRTAQYPSDGHIAARIIKDYGNWPKGSAKGHAAGDIADEAVAYVCSLTAAPSIAEKPVCNTGPIYTCRGKGGRYEYLGSTTGAGKSRGQAVEVYQDTGTGRLFHRDQDDFWDRMELLEPSSIAKERLPTEGALAFRAGRQRLFDLIESMTGFPCLEDDLSEIERVARSYAGDAPGVKSES